MPHSAADLLSHVLLPVANRDDAAVSAAALEPYAPERVTAVHVVEKGDGSPDKLSVEQAKDVAEDAFTAIHDTFPQAQTVTVYDRDIAAAIYQVADDIEASAIVFCARGGSRISRLLAGDHALALVTEPNRPVISLPTQEDTE